MRCERRNCGGKLVERMGEFGRIEFVCLACARNAQGLCRGCPAKIRYSTALRCQSCAKAHRQALDRARWKALRADPASAATLRQQKRRYYATHPEARARACEYYKQYIAAHPRVRTEGDRLYQREWQRQRRREDPAFRARDAARMRARWHRDPALREKKNIERRAARRDPAYRAIEAAKRRHRRQQKRERENARQRKAA